MLFYNKKTYGDFLKSKEKIATNILADRLKLLEKTEIIAKKEHPDNKIKFLYHLAKKGADLLPVLLEIVIWGDKYMEISERGKILATRIKKDKPGLIHEVLRNIQN